MRIAALRRSIHGRLPRPPTEAANLSFRAEPAALKPRPQECVPGSRGIYSAPPTSPPRASRPPRREPASRSVRPPRFGSVEGAARNGRPYRGAAFYRGSARCAARALMADAPWLSTELASAAAGFLGSPPDFFADAAAARRAPLGMTACIDDHDPIIRTPARPPRTLALSHFRTFALSHPRTSPPVPRTPALPSSSRPSRGACPGSCSRCSTPAGRPSSCSPSTGGR